MQLPGVVIGLGRAFAGYLVLFAPLVLFPTVFDEWGLGIARGGLVLAGVPARSPAWRCSGTCCRAMSPTTTVSPAVRSSRQPPHVCRTCLRVALRARRRSAACAFVGAGLGLALPANNAGVMSSVPRSVAAVTGGQVNWSRALGTSVGVALTTFGIHIAGRLGVPSPPVVLATLAVITTLIATTTLRARAIGDTRPRRGVRALSTDPIADPDTVAPADLADLVAHLRRSMRRATRQCRSGSRTQRGPAGADRRDRIDAVGPFR